MTEHAVLGWTATDWAAIGTIVAAIAAVVNAVVVILLARYTYNYMRSTKTLVDAANLQAQASVAQADASSKSLDLLLAERRASDTYQETVLRHEFSELQRKLLRYKGFLEAPSKNWTERERVSLVPLEWEQCVQYVSRKSPDLMQEFQSFGRDLNTLAPHIETIRMTPEKWEATTDRRIRALASLDPLRATLLTLQARILIPASSSAISPSSVDRT